MTVHVTSPLEDVEVLVELLPVMDGGIGVVEMVSVSVTDFVLEVSLEVVSEITTKGSVVEVVMMSLVTLDVESVGTDVVLSVDIVADFEVAELSVVFVADVIEPILV